MASSYAALPSVAANYRDQLAAVIERISRNGKGVLQRKQVLDGVGADIKFLPVLGYVQEAVVSPPVLALALRLRPQIWKYVRADTAHDVVVTEMSVYEFLKLKGQVGDGELAVGDYALELDVAPVDYGLSSLARHEIMGSGLLGAKPFEDPECGEGLVRFLRKHSYNGESLLVNDNVTGVDALQAALTKALDNLLLIDPDTHHREFDEVLRELGLDRGWGDTAKRAISNLHLLRGILETPKPASVDKFFSAVPIVFNVLIVFPHGYVPQDRELGYPDTGGQVACVLDQVRALEEELMVRYKEQGLDGAVPNILIGSATSRQTPVQVCSFQHTINRFAFLTEKGEMGLNLFPPLDWWSYRDIYSEDVVKGFVKEFDGAARADMSANRYGDGKLIAATLLVHKLHVAQEDELDKSRYSYSAHKSNQLEDHYCFPCRFSSYSRPQPGIVYSANGGYTTYPSQLDVADHAASAGPAGVWGVQAVKDSLPTHFVPRGGGWTSMSPAGGCIWSIATPAVLSLLGFTASSLALVVNGGEQPGMFLLFAMGQVGFLVIYKMLRNLCD